MPRRAAPRPVGPPSAPSFVSYIRVSTAQQGASGLGLEAQRAAILRHVESAGGRLAAEFREVESGRKNDRPQLAAALAACRARRATLIIAKLDRLARNVAFISALMDSGVDFLAADNPHATRLTIHIYAAVAEEERRMISERTRAALAVVRRQIAETGSWTSRRSGRVIARLGNPKPEGADRAAARMAGKAASARADRRAADIAPYLDAAIRAGCVSLGSQAEALTARGIRTPAGRMEWTPTQVRRLRARIGRLNRA